MTQTTHTPGPWSFRTTGWSTNPFAIHSPRRPGAVACVPSRTSVPLDEQDANARLIAAAPDLLAALIAAQAMLRELEAPAHLSEADDLDLQISDLITKATGAN